MQSCCLLLRKPRKSRVTLNVRYLEGISVLDNQRKRKICPRCGAPGSGPYARWVLNTRKQRYEPYYYFAHKSNGRLKWCYLGREKLSNTCLNCSNLTSENFCTWQGSYIKQELLRQPFDCEGFQSMKELSNMDESRLSPEEQAILNAKPSGLR